MPRQKISPAYILAKQKIKNKKRPFNADQVSAAAKELGASGGAARANKMHPDRRSEIAFIAAMARWHPEGLNDD